MNKWTLTALQIRGQDRASDVAAEFHEHTKWSTHNISVESLRIKGFLASVKAYLAKGHGKSYFEQNRIVLADSALNGSLQEAFDQRKSNRNLSSVPLSDEILSRLLFPACAREPVGDVVIQPNRRPYPSAGGMFPTEVYVLREVMDEVKASTFNLYHLDPHRKCLSEIRTSISQREVSSSLGAGRPSHIPKFGAAIFLTSIIGRSTGKYGARGYRFALLEAGHLGQNILLTSSSLNLSCYSYGGYLDNPTSDLLGIDGVEEIPLHCILCGLDNKTDTVEIIDV